MRPVAATRVRSRRRARPALAVRPRCSVVSARGWTPRRIVHAPAYRRFVCARRSSSAPVVAQLRLRAAAHRGGSIDRDRDGSRGPFGRDHGTGPIVCTMSWRPRLFRLRLPTWMLDDGINRCPPNLECRTLWGEMVRTEKSGPVLPGSTRGARSGKGIERRMIAVGSTRTARQYDPPPRNSRRSCAGDDTSPRSRDRQAAVSR